MSLLAAVVVVAYKFNLLVFCTAGEQKPLVALPSSHHWEHFFFFFFNGQYMKKTQLNSLDMICSTNRVIDRIPLIYTIGYSYIVTI